MSSLLPFLLSEALEDLERNRYQRPGSIFDQNFGLGVLNDDLLHPHLMTVPLLSGYIRPWRHQASQNSGVSHVQKSNEGFKVNLDVQQFKPDEISVKMIDNFVVVEGKHEERQDEHGYVSRQFCRRYRLPDDVDLEALTSKLSSDGVLSIEAPKKTVSPSGNERVISITHTNAPAVASRAEAGSPAKSDTSEKMDQ